MSNQPSEPSQSAAPAEEQKRPVEEGAQAEPTSTETQASVPATDTSGDAPTAPVSPEVGSSDARPAEASSTDVPDESPAPTPAAESATAGDTASTAGDAASTAGDAAEASEVPTRDTTPAPAASAPAAADATPTVDSTPAAEATPPAEVTPATASPAPPADTSTPSAGVSGDSTESGESTEKRMVPIGSQRDTGTQEAGPSQPKAVREAANSTTTLPKAQGEPDGPTDIVPERAAPRAKAPKSEPVPVPSKRQSSDDIEQQLQAELGAVSMEEVIAKSGADTASAEDIEIQGRYKGTVTRIDEENVFLSLKGRHEGVAAVRSFKKPPEVGAMLDVVVKSYNEEDGIYEVGIPGASVDVTDWSDLQVGSTVEARVTGSNTGGLECVVNNIRGFIPASQIAMHRVENLGDYVNKKLTCVITEAKPKRKNLVLSHRKVLEKELEAVRKETMAKLEVGAIVEGKVTRLREFGAFVDIGGVEGLVHISKLSWERIDKPEEVLQEGQDVKVKIEKVSAESGKISLSYRDTITHPWEGIESKYPVDSTVKGTVSRIAQFGAFVRLESGVEGLIHISELAHHRVVAVKNVVTEGDEVEVKVLSVDRAKQKMGLSLKATTPAPEKKTKDKDETPEEAHRELAVRKRRRPLKGGMDRPSGGESIGLNW